MEETKNRKPTCPSNSCTAVDDDRWHFSRRATCLAGLHLAHTFLLLRSNMQHECKEAVRRMWNVVVTPVCQLDVRHFPCLQCLSKQCKQLPKSPPHHHHPH